MFRYKSIFAIPSTMAVPVYIAPEEIEVGQAIFHHFVHDEFEDRGMSDDVVIDNSMNIIDEHLAMVHGAVFGNEGASTPEGYKSILINNIGSNIRDLANEFAQSRQREQIRGHANEVDLHHITFEHFWGLLEEVFKHGINVYNIVALFFFCSDVLIRCVKQEMIKLGMNLFKWSLQYIAEKVCKWVHENGGWERAIKGVITKKYFAYGTFAVIVCAFGWGLYKGLRS